MDEICKNMEPDNYAVTFAPHQEQRFLDEIRRMEEASEWIGGIPVRELVLTPVDGPLAAAVEAGKYGLAYDLVRDTGEASGLILHQEWNGAMLRHWCVRGTARSTLYGSAKLEGSALGAMSPGRLAQTINNGLAVQKGEALLLIRAGKVSAIHSGAASGYCIMPISRLVSGARRVLAEELGGMEFLSGRNQHDCSACVWTFPEAQDGIVHAYQNALRNSLPSQFSSNILPAVRFYAGDTARSSAKLLPVFLTHDGREIRLAGGVRVRHERSAQEKKDGVALFEEEAGRIFAVFQEGIADLERLANLEILHPENCVVSLCRKFGISQKWGETAREETAILCRQSHCISAHDIYLSLGRIPSDAKKRGASAATVYFLREAVAKTAKADWFEHDVGGTVSWRS